MDMLGKPKMRKVILQYYIKSHEPTLVEWAIQQARQQSVACEEKKSRTSRSTSLKYVAIVAVILVVCYCYPVHSMHRRVMQSVVSVCICRKISVVWHLASQKCPEKYSCCFPFALTCRECDC